MVVYLLNFDVVFYSHFHRNQQKFSTLTGMDFYRNTLPFSTRHNPIRFWFVYLISIVFTFQNLLVAYSSSTYIGQFVKSEQIGILFSLGAFSSIIIFFLLPTILKKYGNVFTTIGLMLITITTLGLVGTAVNFSITVISFVLFLTISPIIYLNIDIFSETLIGKNDVGTGGKRGLALSLMSAAAVFSTISMGWLVGDNSNLSVLFYTSMLVGIFFIAIIVFAFRHFYDPIYRQIQFISLIKDSWNNSDIKTVFTAHFLLQLFFSWTIIYIPLFLATEVGFSWQDIGYIISVGLFAYVLFEYPIGIMADRYIGEKEMMAVGFLVLTLATASISFATSMGIVGWMILMFMSRAGASLVEATTESYFFKKVHGEDANLMSLFRLLRPLANLAGALLGSVCLLFLPFNLIFLCLAFFMVGGIFITTYLHDTK